MRADFYTFWVSWVLPLSIRDFVGLARFFSRKKVQEGLASKPFCASFGQCGRHKIELHSIMRYFQSKN